jgi:multiple sugar transport system permease protein
MVICLLAGVKSIPVELYEAAKVDGANTFQRFWHVTVPAVWNTTLTVSLVLGILAFYSGDFPTMVVPSCGPPLSPTIHYHMVILISI